MPDPGESRQKLAVLRRHCGEAGRDYAQIEKTALLEVDLRAGHQSPGHVIDRFREQADEGIEHVIVNMPEVHDMQQLRIFGSEVIPAVAELSARA